MTTSQRLTLLQAKNFLNNSSKTIGLFNILLTNLLLDDAERIFTLILAHNTLGNLVKKLDDYFDPVLVRKQLLCFKTDKEAADIERIK